jgi:hypothetical protein
VNSIPRLARSIGSPSPQADKMAKNVAKATKTNGTTHFFIKKSSIFELNIHFFYKKSTKKAIKPLFRKKYPPLPAFSIFRGLVRAQYLRLY